MKWLCLLLMACGADYEASHCPSADGGDITVAIKDLDEIKLRCRQWREYTYWTGFELKTIWLCERWYGE